MSGLFSPRFLALTRTPRWIEFPWQRSQACAPLHALSAGRAGTGSLGPHTSVCVVAVWQVMTPPTAAAARCRFHWHPQCTHAGPLEPHPPEVLSQPLGRGSARWLGIAAWTLVVGSRTAVLCCPVSIFALFPDSPVIRALHTASASGRFLLQGSESLVL